MEYEIIKKCITDYESLYSRGMKKDANHVMQELCIRMDSLSSEDTDILLEKLVRDICEKEIFDFLFNRGNGQLPFQLKKTIQNWLLPKCQQGKLPELRWFYNIYKNDPDNSEYAFSCLDIAYAHAPEDQKTQEMLFERNVEALEYGVHELPIGLLISKEEAQLMIRQCTAILQNGYVSADLIHRYWVSKQAFELSGEQR